MIHFRIISVGKTREKWIQQGIDHYTKLLSKSARIEDVIVRSEKVLDETKKDFVLGKEEENILNRLKTGNPAIVLDEHGKHFGSTDFAALINDYTNHGKSGFDFVIGSALGLTEGVRKKADLIMSFSSLTFPHEIAKLLLTEQLYRAMSILSGSKYHK
jgi:23S rRNA (pseudouridine1915-N3)-methyltransferase